MSSTCLNLPKKANYLWSSSLMIIILAFLLAMVSNSRCAIFPTYNQDAEDNQSPSAQSTASDSGHQLKENFSNEPATIKRHGLRCFDIDSIEDSSLLSLGLSSPSTPSFPLNPFLYTKMDKRSEFLGKRMGSEFLGKRMGSEFLGKRMGSEFLGKRMGSEFLGKRMGSEFLGRRRRRSLK
ncbi:uncharacterized protein LOC141855732 isoform X1 [Brevipalpus obovatus]|uniref:uncharacterized protein LOC141855732 isoform X1 n=1 Tax=Brevipalpus obovatus TaxID=246614 RepID=UPI003D9F8860